LGIGARFPVLVTVGSSGCGILRVGVSCRETAGSTGRQALISAVLSLLALVRLGCWPW
jgi:hypothetical protein